MWKFLKTLFSSVDEDEYLHYLRVEHPKLYNQMGIEQKHVQRLLMGRFYDQRIL